MTTYNYNQVRQLGYTVRTEELVLNACRDRNDLLVPNQLERNEAGHIVGARPLARN